MSYTSRSSMWKSKILHFANWYAREGGASIQKNSDEVNCNVDLAYMNGSQHAEQNGKSSKNAIKKVECTDNGHQPLSGVMQKNTEKEVCASQKNNRV